VTKVSSRLGDRSFGDILCHWLEST